MNPHPNTTAAGVATGLGTLAVWLLTRYTSVDLNDEEGGAVVGGIATVVLFVGREGLGGVWRYLVHGSGDPEERLKGELSQ